MKKMMKCLAGLTAAVLMFAFAGQAGAYCVHNGSDTKMMVDQTKNDSFWRSFSVTLYPTEKACCNWSNTDCNKSGGQTDPVAFDVMFDVAGYELHVFACKDYQIPANGDLYITGTNNKYSCEGLVAPIITPPPPPPPFPGP